MTGELRQWHTVTLTFNGPDTSENATPNPFRDYRLQVTFTGPGGRVSEVPGFYAADGNAAESGATSGRKWSVRFVPDAVGDWTYVASFRTGQDVAIRSSPSAGTPTAFDGATGAFTVAPTNKTGSDFRGRGLLQYVGERYLMFAATGERFLKGGADSPENFLAYAEFDGTYDAGGNFLHRYEPHVADWEPGDPTWQGGKGKGIIGALNYLSGKGVNSVYFLTYNVDGGDGRDVWPWTGDRERARFDVSKLEQWEIVFAYMDQVGIQLHLVLQETENDQALDGGELGSLRRLYYRELIARFGHHLALTWNLGEENTNTDQQRRDFARFIRGLDPYDHPIVVHTFPGAREEVYGPLLGFESFEGASLQTNSTHRDTLTWIDRSEASGRPWVVTLDEIGPAGRGVLPDAFDDHDAVRDNHLWGNLMAGGAGVEWYFGYDFPDGDLTLEDFRSRDQMWDQTRYAIEFFQRYLPFNEMRHRDELTTAQRDYVFAKPGEIYAIYLPDGGTTELDLGDGSGSYDVRWYNPRTGGRLETGSVAVVTGAGQVSIGEPPRQPTQDWVVLVTRRS